MNRASTRPTVWRQWPPHPPMMPVHLVCPVLPSHPPPCTWRGGHQSLLLTCTLMAQTQRQKQKVMRATLSAIDEVMRPVTSTDPVHRKEPASVKKMLKGDACWATQKRILGWDVDTTTLTLHLPSHRMDRLYSHLQVAPIARGAAVDVARAPGHSWALLCPAGSPSAHGRAPHLHHQPYPRTCHGFPNARKLRPYAANSFARTCPHVPLGYRFMRCMSERHGRGVVRHPRCSHPSHCVAATFPTPHCRGLDHRRKSARHRIHLRSRTHRDDCSQGYPRPFPQCRRAHHLAGKRQPCGCGLVHQRFGHLCHRSRGAPPV